MIDDCAFTNQVGEYVIILVLMLESVASVSLKDMLNSIFHR